MVTKSLKAVLKTPILFGEFQKACSRRTLQMNQENQIIVPRPITSPSIGSAHMKILDMTNQT